MLERRDYRAIPGVKAADVWAKVWDWWQRSGFALYHVGPNHFTGSSYYSKIGLTREIEVRLQEANEAVYIDVAFRARITEAGAVGGAAAAVLFLPLAVVGGAMLFVTTPPFGTPYPVAPPPAPPAGRACARCGGGLAPEWRVCPYCGQPTTGNVPPPTPSS